MNTPLPTALIQMVAYYTLCCALLFLHLICLRGTPITTWEELSYFLKYLLSSPVSIPSYTTSGKLLNLSVPHSPVNGNENTI